MHRYELAFSTLDLLGTAEDHLSHWHEGLRFGFSFTANDGDKAAKQTGCDRTATPYTAVGVRPSILPGAMTRRRPGSSLRLRATSG